VNKPYVFLAVYFVKGGDCEGVTDAESSHFWSFPHEKVITKPGRNCPVSSGILRQRARLAETIRTLVNAAALTSNSSPGRLQTPRASALPNSDPANHIKPPIGTIAKTFCGRKEDAVSRARQFLGCGAGGGRSLWQSVPRAPDGGGNCRNLRNAHLQSVSGRRSFSSCRTLVQPLRFRCIRPSTSTHPGRRPGATPRVLPTSVLPTNGVRVPNPRCRRRSRLSGPEGRKQTRQRGTIAAFDQHGNTHRLSAGSSPKAAKQQLLARGT
jgi:hypothetical protein